MNVSVPVTSPPFPQTGSPLWVRFAFLGTLFLLLGAGSEALAKPLVSVYWDGRGGFTVMGNQFNRVSGVELRIGYQSEEAPPRVTGRGLGAKASIEVDGDTPGSLELQVKSDTPLSGNVTLATIALSGAVTHVTAWLHNDKGTAESAEVKIINPTDEQLNGLKAKRRPKPDVPPAPPDSGEASKPRTPPASAAAQKERPIAVDDVPLPPVFRRLPSVLELFKAHQGSRTEEVLSSLLRRGDGVFTQSPLLLLSDGRASLKLAIRTPGDRAPRFTIFNADCTGLKIGEEGEWLLEIVPARGALDASITVLTEEEMVEFPLAVAPPLEQFDMTAGPPEVAEYVAAANRLAAEWKSGVRE